MPDWSRALVLAVGLPIARGAPDAGMQGAVYWSAEWSSQTRLPAEPPPGPKPLPFQCVHTECGISGQEGITVGIGRRIAQLYEAKVNALLDRAEDPSEVLNYSYALQQELLPRIRRAVTEVAAALSSIAWGDL